MWDDERHAAHTPADAIGHAAVMMALTDRTVAQAKLSLVQGRPPRVTMPQ